MVIHEAQGAWVTDVEGKRYLDCLSGYSSLNFGHGNPKIIEAAQEQLDRLTLTSRAFYHDQFADFCAGLGDLTGKDMVLPMNTGAEAVETAIKVARKWGYEVKGVGRTGRRSSSLEDNFHGRTTTIVSFSTDPDARDGFGPYTPGFRIVQYGSAEAIAEAIDANTVAVLIEPIQGEAGRAGAAGRLPPGVRELCTEHERAVHRRRDPVGARPHRQDVRLRPRGRRARHVRPGQGAGRRRRAGLGRGRRRRRARRDQARRSTARPSAATRWRARSATRSSSC